MGQDQPLAAASASRLEIAPPSGELIRFEFQSKDGQRLVVDLSLPDAMQAYQTLHS